MRFKTIAIVLAVMFAASIAAAAPKTNTPRGAKRTNAGQRIVKRLGLTQEQIREIKTIREHYREHIRPIAQSNLTKDQKKAQIRDLRNQEKSEITAKLTPEQQAKAKTLWAKHRKGMRGVRMHRPMAQLNLSDSQAASIKNIRQDAQVQARAIKSDTSLDQASKKAGLQALRKDTHERVLSVLTADQRAKLESARKACRRG